MLEEEAKRQSVGNEGPDVNAKDSYPQNSSESDTVWNEHGPWKKNGAGDQKNSKGRVPKQAQGNPILSYWQLRPTNKHKSLLNQDA